MPVSMPAATSWGSSHMGKWFRRYHRSMGFPDSILDLVTVTNEPRIETTDGRRSYKTIIWAVVDDGEVFIRSWKGVAGMWYQRAREHPEVRLHLNGTVLEAIAVHTPDSESIERCSQGLKREYRPGRSLDGMLRDEVLETTLRLDPLALSTEDSAAE